MAFEGDNLMTCQQEDGGYRRQSLLSEGATSRHLDVLLILVFYFSISMTATPDLNSRLQHAQPVEPRGWFRWLHNHLAGRYVHHDADLEKNLAEQGWGELSQRFPNLSPKERAELIPVIARHPWSVGRLELIELAESSWGRFGPSEEPKRGQDLKIDSAEKPSWLLAGGGGAAPSSWWGGVWA
jgi:hypothetical protein